MARRLPQGNLAAQGAAPENPVHPKVPFPFPGAEVRGAEPLRPEDQPYAEH